MAAALLRFAVGAFCLAGVCCGLPTSKPVPGNSSEESAMQTGSQGYVIVAGGNNGASAKASCFAYDINSGTWSALPDLPSGRRGGGLVTHQGMVYYVAGWAATGLGVDGGFNNVLMLSTKQNEWIEGPPLRTIADEGVNALSLNDSLYALGGLTNNLERISSCGQGQFVWNKMASTLQTHYFSGAAVLNGKIYVCGAIGGSRSTFCESYDPSANQFKSVKPMNEARTGLSMVALNGYLYVIGGADAKNERYDPTNDQWTFFSHVPSQKYWQSAATDGERIYVVGGTDFVGRSNLMSMYVPEFDIWQYQTAYPIDIYMASATFVKTLP